MRFDRCRMLFKDDFTLLQKAKVLLLGVGGVGSFCLDCLYRSGVRDITIVDFDIFDVTNQNRQIGSERVGEKKVEVLKEMYPGIKAIEAKITKEWCDGFDFSSFDLVIDAIDDMEAKIAVAFKAKDKLISSMGSAKRVDPSKIEYASIWKTRGDKLAKKFRTELKKRGFEGDFLCIFSTEEPKCKELGSFVGVTGAFGLTLCSLAIMQLTKKEKDDSASSES